MTNRTPHGVFHVRTVCCIRATAIVLRSTTQLYCYVHLIYYLEVYRRLISAESQKLHRTDIQAFIMIYVVIFISTHTHTHARTHTHTHIA